MCGLLRYLSLLAAVNVRSCWLFVRLLFAVCGLICVVNWVLLLVVSYVWSVVWYVLIVVRCVLFAVCWCCSYVLFVAGPLVRGNLRLLCCVLFAR